MGAETLTIPKAEGGAALDRLLELAERYGMDVETVTEETPAQEETPAEEAPVEETPAENTEAPADETPAE